MFKKVFFLALPSIVSNITVPLLGLLDVVIMGHLQHASYIGAIAVGSMMFSLLYWGFGFLRMGTSGLTAQAYGKGECNQIAIQLFRPLLIAFFISVSILALQYPLKSAIMLLIGESETEVCHWASVYFDICIWGAPAVLGLYVMNGWFVGIQRPKFLMYVALSQNLLNVFFSLFFVFQCGMQVEGVAWGTLLAQWIGFFFALSVWWFCCKSYHSPIKLNMLLRYEQWKTYFNVNRDIFGRTLCLIAVTVSFTSLGARQGEVLLAVNTLMMQLFTLFSYVMDGFAFAGESMVGYYAGSQNKEKLRQSVSVLFKWGWLLSIFFTLLYALFGRFFLSLLTNQITILQVANVYEPWVILIPICGFAAFLWDGIFVGLIATRYMLRTMLVAMIFYFGCFLLLQPWLGNHGLWVAFLLYLTVRSFGLWGCYRRNIARND